MKLGADEYAGEHSGEKLPGSVIVHLSKQADYLRTHKWRTGHLGKKV